MATNSTSEPTKDELKAAKKLLKAQEKMQLEAERARQRISKAALEVEREAGRTRMSGHERREQLINVSRHLFQQSFNEHSSISPPLFLHLSLSLYLSDLSLSLSI